MFAQAAILVILAMATVTTTLTVADDEASTAVTTARKEIQFDLLLAETLEDKLTAARQRLKQNDATAKAWRYISEKATNKLKKKAAQASAAFAITKVSEGRQVLDNAGPTIEEATNALRQREANVSAGYKLQSATTIEQGTPTGTPASTVYAGTAGSCKYQEVKVTGGKAACDVTELDSKNIIQANLEKSKLKNLKLLTEAYMKETAIQAEVYFKGTPAASMATVYHGDCQGGGSEGAQAAGTNVLGVKITRTAAEPRTEQLSIERKHGDGNKCLQPATPNSPKPTEILAMLVCEAINTDIDVGPQLTDLTLSNLETDKDMKPLAAILLNPSIGKKETYNSDDEKSLASFIKATYGPENTAFQATFTKPLTTDEIKFKVGGKAVSEILQDVIAGENAGLALAYYASDTIAISSNNESETRGSKTATPTGTAGKQTDEGGKPVCSTIQNQKECEAVKGTIPTGKKSVCGWIEDKCHDSSFLVNKQFALSMVSAAFVAIVTLYNFQYIKCSCYIL
uniref:Variant surface glycoprotein 815 n=1 Tax=Trypanosoma brucei TaxID=5691 RepID=M4SXU4_9TRYP|nr:variant surface glycoprotein 815 [Trypanosoma brucei]